MLMRCNFIILYILCVYTVSSQRLANVQLYPQNNQVLIHFVITAGTSCSGYKIAHSSDGLTYQTIHEYPQICGASGTDEPFDVVHANPIVNQINYYKIEVVPFDLQYESVFVPQSSSNGTLWVCPNPVSSNQNQILLKIWGNQKSNLSGFICKPDGNRLCDLNLTCNSGTCMLNVQFPVEGLYYVVLTDGVGVFSAPCLVFSPH